MYESNGNIVALDNPKRLTVIQGINDCIVAESGNVLLICKKEDEQRIKQFVADAQMKYGKDKNEKIISGLKRISKPGLRIYAGAEELPKVLGGLGIAIISTNKGVLTDKDARKENVGGEVLAFVW